MYSFFLGAFSTTQWLGFDERGKSLYGIEIEKCSSSSSSLSSMTCKLNMLNLFVKKTKTIKKIVVIDLLGIRRLSLRYSCQINGSGEFIGVARWAIDRPRNYQICLISTQTAEFKTYTFRFEPEIDGLFDSHCSTLLNSDENEWIIKFIKQNEIVYYRVILDDCTKSGCFQEITFCEWFNVFQELFFDNQLITFSEKDGYIKQIFIYDFITDEWSQIITTNESGISPVKGSYYVFGRNFENLFAVPKQCYRISNPVLKYDKCANIWRKTKINAKFNLPLVASCFRIDLRFIFNGSNMLIINPNVVYKNDFAHRIVYRYHKGAVLEKHRNSLTSDRFSPYVEFSEMCFMINVCTVLSLKDICLLNLAAYNDYFIQARYEMIIYSYLPQSLIREYFGTKYLVKKNSLLQRAQSCTIL